MKDLVIKASTLRRERNWLLVALVCAEMVNGFAVWNYGRPWTELFTQIGFTVCVAIALYLLLWIPRLVVRVVKCLVCPKK